MGSAFVNRRRQTARETDIWAVTSVAEDAQKTHR